MRFFNRRRILLFFGALILAAAALVGGLALYISSPAFNARARQYIVQEIERRTGATVTLQSFDWSLWHEHFVLVDLTLHGLEPAGEAPLAHIRRIDIGLKLRTLFEKRIDLFELTLSEPEFHVLVSPDGKINIPSPEGKPGRKPFNFEISIENFNMIGGSALLKERRINLDFSTKNLAAVLNYKGAREVLETHLRYDGVLDRSSEGMRSIPYTLAADMDYTRATLIAHKIVVTSGPTQVKLQGRINQLLSRDISGRLEYTGNVQVPFLNYFFTKERFAGKADVAGFLEFSSGYFFTRGNTVTDAVDFEGWHATKLSGEYAYRYPDKRLSFSRLKTGLIGGSVTGNVVVENVPGPAHVILNVDYSRIDAAGLARAYPWDPKYRVFSSMTGTLNGWFEGKLARFEFGGHADLSSYTPNPEPDTIALPLDGSVDYQVRPGQAKVANADLRLYSTSVKAEGLIDPAMSDIQVNVASSNLKDIAFVYADANGTGSFDGLLTGAIARPVLDGEFTLQNHAFRQWKIQQASGGVRLDTGGEVATLRNVRITQGESALLVNGSTALSGSHANLQVESSRVTAQDVRAFVNRDFTGTFAGAVHITELSPAVKLEGDMRANNLSVAGRLIGDARGHLRYFEPVIEVDELTVRQNDSTLAGNVTFNRSNDALKFSARVTSVNLQMFYPLGLPDVVQGVIRQANLRGEGTTNQPNITGNGTIQNISIQGEVFPQAQFELMSTGSKVDLRLNTGKNVDLTAQIDTAAAGYPFTAQARFNEYSIEKIARFSQGTITTTGSVNLSGLLTDRTRLRGQGRIENASLLVKDVPLRTTKPFTVDFNSDRLTLTGVTLTGQATQVNVAGTIAFTERAPLNLDVSGQVDLALLGSASPEWLSNGSMNVQVRLTGTPQMPDLRGIAHLANASFSRRGFFTSLSNVNGDLFFDQNRVTLNNVDGRMGGGTVRVQGTAQLEASSVQSMNIRIESDNVRFRYPEGLRTVINSELVLRGNWTSPLLEGNVRIQNLAYRSDFEAFLALLTEHNLNPTPSPVGRMRLAVHIEGSRNITIQNQLAEVEARIDVDLKGTVDDPSLTGHVEASGGTLIFQGNRYTVTRGNIDFVDPVRIDPVVDIEAESQVRDYRVILTVSGRGDRLHLNMRSDPPLPELEIVSLIAGGRTREEIAARPGSSVPTSEQLFQSGAASLLFDLLQQRVGNRLGLLGTGTRVRVDPFLVGAENNPGARITLSEQVTKDLSITYSQDLSSNRQQVILIEYFVSRNTSILASRDELGNFGVDVRLRKRIK
ncbi:MAG TPA: translocation/assembly module TamB domain-containing protein [Terriglobia bacterium]|nr:translocation/assembly module TamB domain-containing protein [Terriglobia bacterium]